MSGTVEAVLVVSLSRVVVVRTSVRGVLVSEATVCDSRVLGIVVAVTVSVMFESFTACRNSGQSIAKSLPWSNNGSFVLPYT